MATTTQSTHIPLDVLPGVCPDTDATNAQTPHYVMADKIRFLKGKPQKIGGWLKIVMNGSTIVGKVRSIFSANLDNKVKTLLGSSSGLYALFGSQLTNITPLLTSTIAIANSLDTHYGTLANNPITTIIGNAMFTVADTEAAKYVPGDRYTLSGSAAVGGILAADINKTHIIRAVGVNTITLRGTVATSSTTGGGAAVVRATGLLTVHAAAHGLINGQRVKITLAANTGGILAAAINLEFLIRNVATNTFDVMTASTATSSVALGGGGATLYQKEIAAGLVDATSGQGYGMGKYGVGRYGTALLSSSSISPPRTWFFDTYGTSVILTPGNASGTYVWTGTPDVAPTAVTNAPTDINYLFVSNNILVTFGANGVQNRIKGSDQGDITNWTSSSTNQVYTDDIEGMGRLLSHINVNGVNLIFSNNQCRTFRYIGLPDIWEIKEKDNIGIIGAMARVVVKGVGYFMGNDNFYKWEGGNIEIIPSNSSEQSTILKYVFQNINTAQASKSFAWYNKLFDEIWFHYPSAGSNECDRVARYNVGENHWTPDTFDRLAAEYPHLSLGYPRLIDSDNNFFRHEVGTDDDVDSLPFTITTNMQDSGTSNLLNTSIIPDSIQAEDISVQIDARSYPQSNTIINTKTVTVSTDTAQVPIDVDGRFLQYTFSGDELGQYWTMGNWQIPVQPASRTP